MSQDIRIRADGARVHLIHNGQVIDMPPDAAREIAKALMIKAGEAEAIRDWEKTVADQAIMMRSGGPFGLTNNPDLNKLAKIEAVHNTTLRKSNLPLKGIPSGERFGVPGIRVYPPKGVS